MPKLVRVGGKIARQGSQLKRGGEECCCGCGPCPECADSILMQFSEAFFPSGGGPVWVLQGPSFGSIGQVFASLSVAACSYTPTSYSLHWIVGGQPLPGNPQAGTVTLACSPAGDDVAQQHWRMTFTPDSSLGGPAAPIVGWISFGFPTCAQSPDYPAILPYADPNYTVQWSPSVTNL